jgi:hypothetical protein
MVKGPLISLPIRKLENLENQFFILLQIDLGKTSRRGAKLRFKGMVKLR